MSTRSGRPTTRHRVRPRRQADDACSASASSSRRRRRSRRRSGRDSAALGLCGLRRSVREAKRESRGEQGLTPVVVHLHTGPGRFLARTPAASKLASLVVSPNLSSTTAIPGVIAFDGEHSCPDGESRDRLATVPIVASTALIVTVGDHRTVCSPQPAAADTRTPARGGAPPRRTNLAPPATPISLCCFSLGCGVVPGDDVRLRDGRQSCPSRATGGVDKRARSRVGWAASLRMLAQEPDVDPARVPEATGAPIRSHRRRDRN
jgi:hypothetical protein